MEYDRVTYGRPLPPPKKERPTWIFTLLAVIVILGTVGVIYLLFTKKRSRPVTTLPPELPTVPAEPPKLPELPRPSVPSSRHPVPRSKPVEQPKKPLPPVVEAPEHAQRLWSENDLAEHIQILDVASCAQLFTETPDGSSLQLAYGAKNVINKMKGANIPFCGKRPQSSLIVMIYNADCPSCEAVAPKYAEAARIIHEICIEDPTKPVLKFAAISASDTPIYIQKHLSSHLPTFLLYSAPEDQVVQVAPDDLAQMDQYIIDYHANLVESQKYN